MEGFRADAVEEEAVVELLFEPPVSDCSPPFNLDRVNPTSEEVLKRPAPSRDDSRYTVKALAVPEITVAFTSRIC